MQLQLYEETDFSNMDTRKIYYAGKDWKQFDYKKGLDTLINKDKSGQWVYVAGRDWKQFDFDKGLDALIEKDKTGYWIYIAGKDWKQFDYKKGLDKLIKADRNGEWIYYAGRDWKQFDYNKGLEALKKFPKYYKDALKYWPKGVNMEKEKYFVISMDEDGEWNFDTFSTSEDVMKALCIENGENPGTNFTNHIDDRNSGTIVIKGKIANPVPVQVKTKWEIPE